MFARLRDPPVSGIAFLRDEEGVLQSHPKKIDEALRASWQHVFAGRQDLEGRAGCFLATYDEWMLRASAVDVGEISGAALMATARSTGFTAAGPDGWTPKAVSMFSPLAFQWIAVLLNCVEGGLPWPKS
eukprot:8360837-Alexandrium_andersonii.AAC.1